MVVHLGVGSYIDLTVEMVVGVEDISAHHGKVGLVSSPADVMEGANARFEHQVSCALIVCIYPIQVCL